MVILHQEVTKYLELQNIFSPRTNELIFTYVKNQNIVGGSDEEMIQKIRQTIDYFLNMPEPKTNYVGRGGSEMMPPTVKGVSNLKSFSNKLEN